MAIGAKPRWESKCAHAYDLEIISNLSQSSTESNNSLMAISLLASFLAPESKASWRRAAFIKAVKAIQEENPNESW